MIQSTISAFQKILKHSVAPEISGNFVEQFALKRFAKKFEIPDSSNANARKVKTFEQWRDYDASLKPVILPHGSWYRARLTIHKVMKHYRIGELTFTSGSQSKPTYGHQSVADKLLTHDWEVSPDCVDMFVKLAINDHAFIKAAKIKVRKSLGDEYVATVKRIYRIRSSKDDVKKWLLLRCLVCREASRYSTVRKNNATDRSIDLQPFINMLVQRAIGTGLRLVIKSHLGEDLDVQDRVNGRMASDLWNATIDQKNASDSNTWSLVEFLFPAWFVQQLRAATPPYTEGLDGHYYMTNKVSSMGNGFTFELMTLVLLAVCREFDHNSVVFGDDIILRADAAGDLIVALQSAGWVTNIEKSFVSGPFRESCGHNYHVAYGYMRSYDFFYPETIGDCVVFHNKCWMLRSIPYFKKLYELLHRAVPMTLRGPCPTGVPAGLSYTPDEVLDSYFFCEKFKFNNDEGVRSIASNMQYKQWGTFYTYVYRARPSRRMRRDITMANHSHLYFWYLFGGRCSDIPITGKGDWVQVCMVTDGSTPSRVKSFHT